MKSPTLTPPVVQPAACGAERTRVAAQRVLGARVPEVALHSGLWGEVPLALLACERAVIYLYSGAQSWSDGGRAVAVDAAQTRGFREHYLLLVSMGYYLVGISAQTAGEQLPHLIEHNVEHYVAGDPELLLARELGLPIYRAGGRWFYPPLTLVAQQGAVVAIVFPPVPPATSAARVAAWLREHPYPHESSGQRELWSKIAHEGSQ